MSKKNIHPIDLFKKIHDHAPSADVDEIENFGIVNTSINKIGVCVEPTLDVIYAADKSGIDALISHHPATKQVHAKAEKLGIYGLALGLRQDIAPEGNLYQIKEALGLVRTYYVNVELNNKKKIQVDSLSVEFDNKKMIKGAVIGSFKTKIVEGKECHDGEYYYFHKGLGPCRIDPYLDVDDTVDTIKYLFNEKYDFRPRINYISNGNIKEIKIVAVSTNRSLDYAILQQIMVEEQKIDCYICGGIDAKALNFAKKAKIDIMDLGNANGLPGMKNLAHNLGAEFLPNR